MVMFHIDIDHLHLLVLSIIKPKSVLFIDEKTLHFYFSGGHKNVCVLTGYLQSMA